MRPDVADCEVVSLVGERVSVPVSALDDKVGPFARYGALQAFYGINSRGSNDCGAGQNVERKDSSLNSLWVVHSQGANDLPS